MHLIAVRCATSVYKIWLVSFHLVCFGVLHIPCSVPIHNVLVRPGRESNSRPASTSHQATGWYSRFRQLVTNREDRGTNQHVTNINARYNKWSPVSNQTRDRDAIVSTVSIFRQKIKFSRTHAHMAWSQKFHLTPCYIIFTRFFLSGVWKLIRSSACNPIVHNTIFACPGIYHR